MNDEEVEINFNYMQDEIYFLKDRIDKLEDCLMCALNYRPLETDPFQVYVKSKYPDVIDKWRKRCDG